MKRFYFFIITVISSIAGFSQIPTQIQAKRGVFTERLFLTDRWIDRITPDMYSTDSLNDNILPTAKAVADYIRNHAMPNFATADLTLTGDRTHNGGGYNLIFNNFKSFLASSGYSEIRLDSSAINFNQTHGNYKWSGLKQTADTVNYKPLVVDASGAMATLSGWPYGAGGTSSTQSFAQTSTVTVSGTTSETSITGSGTGSLTIPASKWVPGKSYRVTVYGTYSTNNSSSAYFTLRLKIGNTTVATATSALNVGNANQFTATISFTCRTTGSSGSVYAFGTFIRNAGLFNWNNGVDASGVVAAPVIDLTTDQIIGITAQLSDASAGNTISSYIVNLEEIN